jgi:lysophospholipase L1-like esterase
LRKINVILSLKLISLVSLVQAQTGDYFLGLKHYPFIKYEKNTIITPADSNYLEGLYDKFDQIINYGEGKINIIHIGGSHIQADIYTNQIRKRFQSLQYDMNGGRGMVFPYRIAKTNNPSNYRVSYTGNWEYSKNTQYKRTSPVGLNGISVTTKDKRASIKIDPNPDSLKSYTYTQVKIFHSLSSYQINLITQDSVYKGTYDSIYGYSTFTVKESCVLNVSFSIADSISDQISVYGISLENDDPGVVYHAIGVNGAKLKSYLGCEYYSQHISALNPDLVIFSIGTNDGNTRYFDSDKYYSEYERLIELTKIAAPNAYIMITVPNDCYMYKRYVNPNTQKLRSEIFTLAKKNNYAIWDLYSIMGGLNSSMEWYRYGLMRYDRIHFNRQGYLLKGDLFVTAFLKGWERNLASRNQNVNSNNMFLTEKPNTSQAISE